MATRIPDNRAAFTVDEIVAATSGTSSRGSGEVCGVVIDSRRVVPGNLFVALRGEAHDAHRFVGDAVRAGAAAVVVARDADVEPGAAAVIAVDDTLRALGDLAATHRRRLSPEVVGITGSAGKTSTKELVAAALGAAGRTLLKTHGNLNNRIGVPMMLFCLDDTHDLAVLELGTSEPGEIARLAELAAPDVGLVTLVAAAHTEGLGSVEDVAFEKGALLRALHPGGHAIVSGDDGTVERLTADVSAARTWFFGRAEGCDVRLVAQSIDAELRTRIELRIGGVGRRTARLHLLGEAAGRNAAAAVAVALACGADLDAAVRGLETVTPHSGRMAPIRAGRHIVLDDSYNANPRSTAMALDTAAEVAEATGGRLVAALADMKELGLRSAHEHAAIGRHAAAAGVEVLALVGSEIGSAADPARDGGVGLVQTYDDAADAVDELVSWLRDGDVVLVKGSRSMRMERIVDALVGSQVATHEGAPS